MTYPQSAIDEKRPATLPPLSQPQDLAAEYFAEITEHGLIQATKDADDSLLVAELAVWAFEHAGRDWRGITTDYRNEAFDALQDLLNGHAANKVKSHAQRWADKLAALPPIATGDPTLHPRMTLEIEGVTIAVKFDRWDADQAQYEWEVSCQNVTDRGEMRAAGGEPIALDGAITQIIEAMTTNPAAFPLMAAANLDLAYIASQAAHYLPTTP